MDDASRLLVTCSKQTRTPSPSPSPDLLPSVEMLSSSLALDAGVLEQPVEFVAGNPTIAAEARRVFPSRIVQSSTDESDRPERTQDALPESAGPEVAAGPQTRATGASTARQSGSQPATRHQDHSPVPAIAAEARRVFEAWKLDTGHVRATLDRKRQVRIEARLREGSTADELILAITHRRNDPWLMGTAEGATRVFDGIETLLRDAAQVERLRDLDKPLQTVRRGPGPVQKDRGNNPCFSIEKLRAEGAVVGFSAEPYEPADDIAF